MGLGCMGPLICGCFSIDFFLDPLLTESSDAQPQEDTKQLWIWMYCCCRGTTDREEPGHRGSTIN